MRRCSTWYIGNCKLEWHIILHLLEWPESEYQILLRMWINRNSINTLIDGGMQNGIATSGNSLADSYKSEKTKQNKTFYHMILQLCFLVFTQMNWKHVHTKICTWLFMAALFIIAKTWKQPTCPSVHNLISLLSKVLSEVFQHHISKP